MAIKPSEKINWTKGNPDQATIAVEPTAQKKEDGFFAGERPSRKMLNWMFKNIYEWFDYFEELTDEVSAKLLDYDAIVGSAPGCTHATLQAAINAASSGWKILVTEDATINARITVTVADIEIVFKPGVEYTKGSETVCMEYSTARTTVKGGRFVGFTGGGDIVHRFLLNADYCSLINPRYGVGTTTDLDDSAVTAGKKPVAIGSQVEI